MGLGFRVREMIDNCNISGNVAARTHKAKEMI